MTRVFVDATTLVALGTVGELDLLGSFDGTVAVPAAVRAEVTTEPARTNLDRLVEDGGVVAGPVETDWTDVAVRTLDESEPNGDVRLLEGVLAALADEGDGGAGESGDGPAVGLVSDDRRLRALADGLGATVTGTFGVVVRAAAADKYFSADQAKRVVRRIDSHGTHLTGELREQAIGAAE